jgi:predicted nucleic acid-binding protein
VIVEYLETSALLRLLLGQEGAEEVRGRLARAEHAVSSRLLEVEADRALLRILLDRPGSGTLVADMRREFTGHLRPRITFFEITREICVTAGRVAPASRLRALDAIHIATFLNARELSKDVRMLSFDERILSAL